MTVYVLQKVQQVVVAESVVAVIFTDNYVKKYNYARMRPVMCARTFVPLSFYRLYKLIMSIYSNRH